MCCSKAVRDCFSSLVQIFMYLTPPSLRPALFILVKTADFLPRLSSGFLSLAALSCLPNCLLSALCCRGHLPRAASACFVLCCTLGPLLLTSWCLRTDWEQCAELLRHILVLHLWLAAMHMKCKPKTRKGTHDRIYLFSKEIWGLYVYAFAF